MPISKTSAMKSKCTLQSTAPFKPSSMPWLPSAYMRKAVKFLLEHAAAALFLDPGLRKTSITLAALSFLLKKGLISKVLIVAPLRVCYSVWPEERDKWKDFNHLKMVVLHGKDKDQLLKSDADIFVINPEGLDWLLDVQKERLPSGKIKVFVDLKRWKKLGFDTLVIDELSKFKHTTSSRFKSMKLVIHTFGRRWGLTGSPVSNGLLNLFGQCFMLDQGRTLGPYISHYRAKYFVPAYDGFNWTLREGADEEIYERVRPLALRMAAEDYIDMPKLIENNIKVQLPTDVMKVYLELENDLFSKIEKNTVRAATSAAASMKCRQVANGGIYLDQEVRALVKLPKSEREWLDLHYLKTDAVEELVEELQGSPLLVAYDFNHDLARLQERFGKDVPNIGSGVSPKKSKVIEDAWNRGELPLLLAHPQSAGHGLNLQESGFHVAWHSMTYDWDLYDQLIRRLRRSGQKSKRIYVHNIMASGTVDEDILMSLKSKDRGQQAFFNALKARGARK
jgi:YD repeat-containing protein